jgi:hypothetical protein
MWERPSEHVAVVDGFTEAKEALVSPSYMRVKTKAGTDLVSLDLWVPQMERKRKIGIIITPYR